MQSVVSFPFTCGSYSLTMFWFLYFWEVYSCLLQAILLSSFSRHLKGCRYPFYLLYGRYINHNVIFCLLRCLGSWRAGQLTYSYFAWSGSGILKRPRGRAVSASGFGSRRVAVRIPLEAKFFPNLNGASLHTSFHVHPSLVSKWLKYCWKGRKTLTHPSVRHPKELTSTKCPFVR